MAFSKYRHFQNVVQRVIAYRTEYSTDGQTWQPLYNDTSIGDNRPIILTIMVKRKEAPSGGEIVVKKIGY